MGCSAVAAPVRHRRGTAERRAQIFAEAVTVIVREHAHDLQVEEVAREIAVSRRQLQRVLAEVGGTSFREMLQTIRLSHARRLLAEGGRVGVVAVAVGYRYQSQFTKAFQRQFGISPSQFRGRAPVTARAGQR